MSDAKLPTGKDRDEGLHLKRDPLIDEQQPASGPQTADPAPTQLPESEYGANEMSKAWARESYRADFGRASQHNRNEIGTKRVDGEDQNPV